MEEQLTGTGEPDAAAEVGDTAEEKSQAAQLLAELGIEASKAEANHPRPDRLSVTSIKQLPELFQPRGNGGVDERHISELRRALKVSGAFDPVTVLWIGDVAYLVDGHHRVAAYLAEKHFGEIPIQSFAGTVGEAVLEAGRANSRAKLAMGSQQRNDYAWRLVVMGSYTKRQIVEAAGVSDGQVAIMRRAMKDLGAEAVSVESWWRAQRLAQGKASALLSDDEKEELLDARARDYADRMQRAFSNRLANNPEIAARALAIYFGRNLGDVWQEMKEFLGDAEHDPNSRYDPADDF